jgi:hypothetical protein
MPEGLAFNPYLWSEVHYFRRSQAILANQPWMEMPIILLRPTHPDRWSYHDPDAARQEFETSMRSELPGPDFVVQAGLPDLEIDRFMQRSGWSESGQPNPSIKVYRRR